MHRSYQRDVLKVIPKDKWIAPEQIHNTTDISKKCIYQHLYRMLEKGLLERKISLQDTRVKLYRKVA